ncbi:Golgi transport complex subunit 5-domain-containing protein [Kalaharituber pfeilii]|nr:Golgi transport complex subunit 5-domain-containing protein [Kalaharituber pfeilii]
MATELNSPLATPAPPDPATAPASLPPDSTYIDYETFLSPTFNPYSFANALILHTNTRDDPTLDLSTPLSRVLFDLQEIDSHIHNLTTQHAETLLLHAGESRAVSVAFMDGVEGQLKTVMGAYRRLEKEVLTRSETAGELVRVVERLHAAGALLRCVVRVVGAGRRLEGVVGEWFASRAGGAEGDWKSLLRMGFAVAEVKAGVKAGGVEMEKVGIVQTLVSSLAVPAEQYLKTTAGGTVSGFVLPSVGPWGAGAGGAGTGGGTTAMAAAAVGGGTLSTAFTFQKALEQALVKVACALQVLYLLSSPSSPLSTASKTTTAKSTATAPNDPAQNNLLLTALTAHLTQSSTASLAALSRVFSQLTPVAPAPPALDRSLAEIVGKLRGIVALEEALRHIPLAPLTSPSGAGISAGDTEQGAGDLKLSGEEEDEEEEEETLLSFVLAQLDTPTLPMLFLRNLATGLETLVRNVLARGGVSARGLRAGKEKVREGLSVVVERGLGSMEDGYAGVLAGAVGFAAKEVAGVVGGAGAGVIGLGGGVGLGSVAQGKGGRKRKDGEREVGIGVVVGAVERGFAGGGGR